MMTHKDILKRFLIAYPIPENMIDCWFPNGKGSIRVRFVNHVELIFSYSSDKNWRIETVDSFLNDQKLSKK